MGGGPASQGLMGAGGGAGSGALMGAILGSAVPGIGTVLGALIGAGAGGLSGGLGGAEAASNQTSPLPPMQHQPGPSPNFNVLNPSASHFGASSNAAPQSVPPPPAGQGGGDQGQNQAWVAPPAPSQSQAPLGSLPQSLNQKPAGQNQGADPAIQQAALLSFFQRLKEMMQQGQAPQGIGNANDYIKSQSGPPGGQ